MSVSPEQVAAGHAVFTKRVLAIYDFLVLGLSNRLIWSAPRNASSTTTTGTSRRIIWMLGLEPAIFSTVAGFLQTRHVSR